MMNANILDNPLILSVLFHPRLAHPGGIANHRIKDGTIPVDDAVHLGYRLYIHQAGQPVIVFFHGNGEIAPDYDSFAPAYWEAGASLLVVDYRGYGWSSGQPLFSTLLPDAEKVLEAVPGILSENGLGTGPLYIMGRSLGSAPAIHLAHHSPQSFKGLIIESGFAHILPLLARLGLSLEGLSNTPDPIGNARKMKAITLPLLVIHGGRDTLIPVENGKTLYEGSPAEDKRLKVFPQAGHNDLLYWADEYFATITQFIAP